MATFHELWGEECSICLSTNQDFYFNNECFCKHLICEVCVYQVSKCPLSKCRSVYSFIGLQQFGPFHMVTVLEYLDMTYTEYELYLAETYINWTSTISYGNSF